MDVVWWLAGVTTCRYGFWSQVGIGTKERERYSGVYIIAIDYRFCKSWTHLPPYLSLENVLSIWRTKHFAILWRVRGKGRIKHVIMEPEKVSRQWVYMGCGRDWRLAVVIRCGGLKSSWISFVSHVKEENRIAKIKPHEFGKLFIDNLKIRAILAFPCFAQFM